MMSYRADMQRSQSSEQSNAQVRDYMDSSIFQHLKAEGYIQAATDIVLQLYVNSVSLFSTSTHNVKPLLIVNMSLPPHLRVKKENLLCVGIILGPTAKG